MAATHLRSLLFASFALITCSAIGQNSDLTILGTLGGPSSVAYDVAADSWVVGAADTAGGNGAFVALPTGGTLFNMLALPKPSGWISGEARGINQFHQIAGWIFSPSAGRAMPWVWAGTSLGAQLPLPPGALGGGVYAINDLGQAVGWREHGSLSIIQRPCFWDPVLGPTVIGTYQGEALAINNRGVVADWTYDDNGYQVGFVWDLLLGIRLLPKAPTWTQFKATGINDQGVVVGTAQVGANTRAIKWPGDGTYVDLGTLGGAFELSPRHN